METKEKELSFEESLTELETIVKKLEIGEVPLEEAIEEFKKAMDLAKKCDKKLKDAENSINKILNDDGTITDFKVEE